MPNRQFQRNEGDFILTRKNYSLDFVLSRFHNSLVREGFTPFTPISIKCSGAFGFLISMYIYVNFAFVNF